MHGMNEESNKIGAGSDAGRVEQRLLSAWRRERSFFHARGLFHICLWGAGLLAVDFAVDWLLGLSGGKRVLLLAANLAVLLVVFYLQWWRALNKYDRDRVALQIERLYPQLQSLLVTFVQLKGRAEGEGGMSPGLVRAMAAQAVDRIQSLDFGKIVRFRSLRRIAGYSFAVLVVVTVAATWKPAFFKVFATRMLNPASEAGYPTRTTIESISGDITIQQGGSVHLQALIGGVIPDSGLIMVRGTDAESAESVRVIGGKTSAKGTREFAYRFNEVFRGFSYSYRVGDAVSKEYRVTVVPPPRTDLRVGLTYPGYTGLKPRDIEMLTFEILEGSQAEWRFKSDRPLSSAEMIMENGSALPMTLAPDGKSGKVSLSPAKTFSYGFRWKDKTYGFVYAPDTRYPVRVVPDRPPKVSLITPERDEKATSQKVVDISFTARDDYGLSSARIVYSIEAKGAPNEAGQEKAQNIGEYKACPVETNQTFVWEVQRSLPGLKPGDIVRYAVEVLDNRVGTAGAARSDVRRLTIVSFDDYLQMVMEERKQLMSKIKDLHAEETRASTEVKGLKGAKKD